MPSTKPILIFVPGAWHSPSSFTPTTTLLQKAGYTTIGVSLPTIVTELEKPPVPPQQNWDDDVAAIRTELLKQLDAGLDVVLITHSYSGTVGFEACHGLGKVEREEQGLKGGVVKLVYLAALVLDVGHYIWEATGGKPFDEERTVIEGYLSWAEPTRVVSWFYNECSPEQQAAFPQQLQRQSWKIFTTPVTYTAWREIAGVFLMTEKDQAIPLAWQEAMLDAAKGHKFEIEKCDADHSPFVSRPEFTANLIRRAAGEIL